jgi:predicted TIM-barrel fold metal-dependent hydrolase
MVRRIYPEDALVVQTGERSPGHGGTAARNLAARNPADKVEQLASRIRQIGVERVVFGSDMYPNPDLKTAWATFRNRMPLTVAEVSAIAENEAPYMRGR